MTKTHKSILPIIAVLFSFFFGWSTISAQTIEKLTNQLRDVQNLPAGSVFQLTLTDEDATAAAAEYMEKYMEEIQQMIEQSLGMKLNFSDPRIDFDKDRLVISVRGGMGFLKITVSASGIVKWDVPSQTLHVDIQSVDIPIISVDPATVNSYIQAPINDFIHNMMKDYDVLSFNVYDGYAILEARKK